jgi:hypothetical protein
MACQSSRSSVLEHTTDYIPFASIKYGVPRSDWCPQIRPDPTDPRSHVFWTGFPRSDGSAEDVFLQLSTNETSGDMSYCEERSDPASRRTIS